MITRTNTTKAELSIIMKLRLLKLIKFAGSQADLARMIGVPGPTVGGWIRRQKISKRYAKVVGNHEKLGAHFTAEYLRPDLEW